MERYRREKERCEDEYEKCEDESEEYEEEEEQTGGYCRTNPHCQCGGVLCDL
jgi:hypothetical protein